MASGGQQSLGLGGSLWFGDNLTVLREHIDTESVDLVYLDPPWNSNRNYNILFAQKDGRKAASQIRAFDDTWTWDRTAAWTYEQVVNEGGEVADMLVSLRQILGTSDMLAYLTMMTPRLVELHRVLRASGSLYLHCDPTASHYLKIVLDAIFGPVRFQNEISWMRSGAKNDSKRFGRSHDVIFFYTKTANFTWHSQYTPFEQASIDKNYTMVEEGTDRRYRHSDLTAGKAGGDVDFEWNGVRPYRGRHWAYSRENLDQMLAENRIEFRRTGMPVLKRYLDEQPGVPLQDFWADLRLTSAHPERLGYPTQKPLSLMERIIGASSDEGDVVLDPFCGCGTTVDAAQGMGRRWVGIDITEVAVTIIQERLSDKYGYLEISFKGEPTSVDDAEALARLDKHEFQVWACRAVGVKNPPTKKGADGGVDGTFSGTYENGDRWKGVVSVKGGGVNVSQLRDLHGTVDRQNADFGVFVTLKRPSKPMRTFAADAGFTSEGVPRLQILTVAEILDNGARPNLPDRSARPGEVAEACATRRLRAV